MAHKEADLLIDYFNNQLDEVEKKRFEKHLEECVECSEELEELRMLTEDLPFDSEPITPPPSMKDRVLTNVFDEEKQTGKQDNEIKPKDEETQPMMKRTPNRGVMSLIAAALVVSLMGNIYALVNQDNTETAEPEVSLDKILGSVQLKASEGIEAEASATMIEKEDGMNVVVQANQLEPLNGDEAYQVWVLEEGKPYRAGTFVPNDNGEGAVSYHVNYEGEHNWDTIAITKEPNPTNKTPKGEIILSSSL
ncbi:anti-sigma factor [Radiobacillus kanasensis]|uniref:anti-sigma factor n=1 Tax=Radiobacillus kanasensis TaxID=2844358 RepID=UPI001E362CB8|nr:anti-sigma factor [Radiobacillus kanasensis]UFT99055.1 anti-sigma factor [Radiobacillus kanasensis]